MIALILGLFHFTHPIHQQTAGDCSADSLTYERTLFDLSTTEVWGYPTWSTEPTLLLSWNSAGMEGLRDQFFIPDVWMGTIYVVEVDSVGNKSCPSNMVSAGIPTVSVPPSITFPQTTIYYDLQGRKVDKPTKPGIYFARTGTRVRRIVKLF